MTTKVAVSAFANVKRILRGDPLHLCCPVWATGGATKREHDSLHGRYMCATFEVAHASTEMPILTKVYHSNVSSSKREQLAFKPFLSVTVINGQFRFF